MLRLIYTALLHVAAPVALAATALRGLRDPSYRGRLAERLGYTSVRFGARPIWIHAVSVGEVQAAAVLVRALRSRHPRLPIVMTTSTPTGAQRVQALFGDAVAHCYLPYDLPGAAQRFLRQLAPRIAIVMEREIWPNLFRACRQRGIPVVLASARLSQRSVQGYRRWRDLFEEALEDVSIAAQTAADAARFREIGADGAQIQVAGNVKFDIELPAEVHRSGDSLRQEQFATRAVWVAGSTHEGEEDIVLAAHERVRAQRPDALLILVPRHPTRFDAVKARLTAARVSYALRSKGEAVGAEHSVLLVDTLGELLMFYAAADVAFVGGSLVPQIGGHNLLEPAALAKPIVVGPHNANAPDIAELLLTNQAALSVADDQQLAAAVSRLLADPQRRELLGGRARDLVVANRGALARMLSLIEPLLGEQ